MYFPVVVSRVAVVLAILSTLLTALQPASAQSPARAPVLDTALKDTIRAMTVVNDRKMPVLEGRGLVISFFASWCPPCRPEFAELNALRQTFSSDDLTIIAINLFESYFADEGGARMKRFLRQTQPGFVVVQAKDDVTVTQSFGGVDRIPTVYIYDRAGNPVYTFIHQQGASKMHATAKEITPFIQKALTSPTK